MQRKEKEKKEYSQINCWTGEPDLTPGKPKARRVSSEKDGEGKNKREQVRAIESR
jgi:hypothetical protein